MLSITIAIFLAVFVASEVIVIPLDHAIETCGRDLQVCESRLASYRALTFPDDRDTQCFVKCVLIELHAWSNPRGLLKHSTIQQYFIPDSADCDYEERTRRCLDQTLPNCIPGDSCSRAYWSFLCYKDNYGNLVRQLNQFIPPTELDISQHQLDCVDILKLPREELLNSASLNDSSNCYARCLLLRSEIYTDENGLDLDRLYVLVGYNAKKKAFLEYAKQYLAATSYDCQTDRCRAAQVPYQLFHEQLVHMFRTDGTRDISYVFDVNNV
ncbi:general odorant-binding protein 45-like [Ochlerotatus camptorhynchus]|uniref:general odorant-binding protein 45-like n=1 Tax=Ochlerotatus camptorhynchus TaxID=644619 RepID=UPI0031DAA5A4